LHPSAVETQKLKIKTVAKIIGEGRHELKFFRLSEPAQVFEQAKLSVLGWRHGSSWISLARAFR
jgi:hypothetical protein